MTSPRQNQGAFAAVLALALVSSTARAAPPAAPKGGPQASPEGAQPAHEIVGPTLVGQTGLRVVAETLNVVCVDACHVEATYTVENPGAVRVSAAIEFAGYEVTVTVDGGSPTGEVTGREEDELDALTPYRTPYFPHFERFRLVAEPGTRHTIVASGSSTGGTLLSGRYVRTRTQLTPTDRVCAGEVVLRLVP